MFNWFKSRRLQYLLATTAILLGLFTLMRAIFYFGFADHAALAKVPAADLWYTLSIGTRFDWRLACLIVLPLAVVAILPRFNLATSTLLRRLANLYLGLVLVAIVLLYFVDFGHYVYLGIRMDSSVIRFVDDVAISGQMMWESYPVVWITLAWLGGAAFFTWLLVKVQQRLFARVPVAIARRQMVLGSIVLFVVAFSLAFGRYSTVPLRWSHAFYSGNSSLGAIGLNPILYFNDSFQYREFPYQIPEVKKHYPQIAEYLGVESPDAEELNYLRRMPAAEHAVVKAGERQPNVVVIMLESLGASRLGMFGNPLTPSPNLDALANEGVLYPNFYVPISGTAKTVFGSITGLPDVTVVKSATRNPLISEQRTVINALTDHDKYYLIGGSSSWANMGALIKLSIDDVKMYEEGDYDAPNVDVWGISDLELFKAADRVFRERQAGKPFFAYIQTAGNHRPFTIPEDNDGFETVQVDAAELNQWGFRNNEQFNAVRLLDFNIGKFFDMAKAGGYYDNTIFVFFGDHNNRITSTPHMAPFYEKLDLDGLHVPFFIHAPDYLEAGVDEQAASLLDVMPTIAGLVGVPYENNTLGRDLNLPSPEGERFVFTQTADRRFPIIGAISKDFMLRMKHDASEVKLHDLNSDTPERDVSGDYPEKAARLQSLAKGIYETTKYLHYHNSPRHGGVAETQDTAAE
ncbi:LTA synthase family protein [Biformimicrobium ophioploci]|uniref:LTA synthase family protein n=1 Tax=Biformimicrobium ophioploci TaxID=3036711 RepID=A0ABQ6M2I3_9GAMM|nr:alkaline phosphatase family protein [Microbulbifer sp. NKW57]GMG88475.1 LTA synthase family protein [Microbulbifer sp. NKW57]